MANLIAVDFGKDRREFFRKLDQLSALAEKRNADFLKDPRQFFEHAGAEIGKRENVLIRAWDALQHRIPCLWSETPPPLEPFRTVSISADEYERLKACEKIILDWGASR